MTRRALLLALLALPLLLARPVAADDVYLKSGQVLKGTITAEHPDRIEIKLASGEVRTVPRDDIAMVKKGISRADEFRDRLKAVADDDVEGLLELATWCDAEKLSRQRVTVHRKLLKADPDCPEARRGLRQCWNGSKWVKDPKKCEVEPPATGASLKAEKIGLELLTLRSWKADDGGAAGLTLSGPDRYRHPVRLEILPLAGAPETRFSGENGWSEPKAVRHKELEGLSAERTTKEGVRRVRVREHAVTGKGWSLLFRLSSLACEFEDWTPHLDYVLENLKVLAPKLDYINKALGIGFRLPEGHGWAIPQIRANDGTVPPLILAMRQGERGALDYGRFTYIRQGPAETTFEVGALLAGLTRGNDVKSKTKTTLGTQPAEVWDYTGLSNGVPVRGLALVALDGKYAHTVNFTVHERSFDELRAFFDRIRESFTTGLK